MAIRNPLQEQLLKAGLVNKNKVDQVARQQQKARDGKPTAKPEAEAVDAHKLQAERAERDRQLEAHRKAEREAQQRSAQIRQIIEAHRVKAGDDSDYRFSDDGVIRSLRIGDAQRPQLARGVLTIARLGDTHALLARDVAERVRAIDPSALAVDHAHAPGAPEAGSDDAFYSRFQVPDDLIW